MDQTTDVNRLAKIVWDYHNLHQKPEKADCILALGSNDIRVAERAAQLFFEGLAPLVIFSGGRSRLTPAEWRTSEAEEFAKRAISMGVPENKILIENTSRNTGENIELTKQLLAKRHLNPKRIILVQNPYMERRSYATFEKVWPGKELIVTSPQISFENYPNEKLSKDFIINIMVGYLQRIRIYPEKGFQIHQEIPDEVWDAYNKLVALGYTKHLVHD